MEVDILVSLLASHSEGERDRSLAQSCPHAQCEQESTRNDAATLATGDGSKDSRKTTPYFVRMSTFS
jgi:hypothetical protein